jgi:phage terminase large subunit GpA-like protein
MLSDLDWLVEKIDSISDSVKCVSPSQWSEENRYLPPSVTPIPGYYSYDVAPYLREIVDCVDMNNEVREVNIMKGAQIGATVGVLENAIGYAMSYVKSAPVLMVTADAELAQYRMESYITPMIQQSGLADLVRSADETNTRKTGKTDKKIEWVGGGFLIPLGARNAGKLRSISAQYLLLDECDGYPETVGQDGDPVKLVEARTKGYQQTRKVVALSTPLIKGASRIEQRFLTGDQRYFNVPCRGCGEYQILRFQGANKKTGEIWGLDWEMDGNRLKPGSVRYICRHCGHKHINSDKIWMLPRGKWVPTAKPKSPTTRSYHISALYSPASMFSWEDIVVAWLEAWDVKESRPKDLGLLQEFYNNNLGEAFEIRGDRIRFDTVSAHRRNVYSFGGIPNVFAQKYAESRILLLTCAVDVHKDNLAVAVFGWTKGARAFVIDYWRFNGDTEQLSDECWHSLRDLIETKEYIADDGARYKVQTTLIDSGYRTEQVYSFCEWYESGVYPIKGRNIAPKNATHKEFSQFATPKGQQAFSITVDIYKERWAAALRREWHGVKGQPYGHFNAPLDITDRQLKELTAEQKRERKDKRTGKRIGFEWHRNKTADNELWDLLVYNNAALEIMAWSICRLELEMDFISWVDFWDICEKKSLFFNN